MKSATEAVPRRKPASQLPAWSGFVSAIVGIGMIWLIVLPLVESEPHVAKHIANQKRLGVDPMPCSTLNWRSHRKSRIMSRDCTMLIRRRSGRSVNEKSPTPRQSVFLPALIIAARNTMSTTEFPYENNGKRRRQMVCRY